MKVFEMFLNEEELEFGMKIVSIVEDPAMDSEYVMLAEQSEQVELAAVEDEQMLYGAIMIPNKRILRMPKEGEPYFVTFSANTIKQTARRFMKQGLQGNVDMEHSRDIIDGATVVEAWLVTDPNNDKSNALGIDVPEGTLMVGTHIEDKEQWVQLKDSKKTGFSLDGSFRRKPIEEQSIGELLLSAVEAYKSKNQ
jgi:hypothetical protein